MGRAVSFAFPRLAARKQNEDVEVVWECLLAAPFETNGRPAVARGACCTHFELYLRLTNRKAAAAVDPADAILSLSREPIHGENCCLLVGNSLARFCSIMGSI